MLRPRVGVSVGTWPAAAWTCTAQSVAAWAPCMARCTVSTRCDECYAATRMRTSEVILHLPGCQATRLMTAASANAIAGGANEAVLRMLERIGSTDNIPGFIEGVKNRKEKLFGFGHR